MDEAETSTRLTNESYRIVIGVSTKVTMELQPPAIFAESTLKSSRASKPEK
jgi:hypothetical protein